LGSVGNELGSVGNEEDEDREVCYMLACLFEPFMLYTSGFMLYTSGDHHRTILGL